MVFNGTRLVLIIMDDLVRYSPSRNILFHVTCR